MKFPPPRWLSQQALFSFHLNVHYPGILEILRNRFLVPCPFTQLRETLKQLFTALLVDLISEGLESALGDLPEDICWIVHRTSATNGVWPIYEVPRPTVGSYQAQYCQRPTADSARIGNAQPSAGIDKSLCHHSNHKVWIEKESSRLWMNSVTSSSDAGIDDDIGNRLG